MKWYFASRTRHKELIKSVAHILENHDHQVVFNWAAIGSLEPYHENAERCNKIAQDISDTLSHVDIFVLISDPTGTDMFVELGIAIANWMHNQKSRIYIVGKYNKRSLMHFHPSIIHVDTLEEIFMKECPEVPTQNLNKSR